MSISLRSARAPGWRVVALTVLWPACTTELGPAYTPTGEKGPGTTGQKEQQLSSPMSGARRLTRYEYLNTVRDLLGVDISDHIGLLPEDFSQPFDNDYLDQEASDQLIAAAEILAAKVASLALSTDDKRNRFVPCEPKSKTDTECFRTLVQDFGEKALRRPMPASEVDLFVPLLEWANRGNRQEYDGEVETNFYTAVDMLIRVMLQQPEFLYRVERGSPIDGEDEVRALSNYEVASRLSYLIWGSMPDAWLFLQAQNGALVSPEKRRAVVTQMLDNEKAVSHMERFHAQWLGYSSLPQEPALLASMRTETNTLLRRVIFEENLPYQEIFLSDETFVDAPLARHYGLDEPNAGWAWSSYGGTSRQGVLSHGTVLSAFSKFDDTSPTQRGIFIRTRLMCETVNPPPPELEVDVDAPPSGQECKTDRYKAHRTSPACAGCHSQLDPVGFGLEQYDKRGRFRSHDDGKPECTIDGDGQVAGVGDFNGPKGLSDLLVASGRLEACFLEQVYRFATGRPVSTEDAGALAAMGSGLRSHYTFKDALLAIASDPSFAQRREERE